MADYAREGSSDRTLRSHGEQIRRIRTRIPTDPTFSVYQLQQTDLYYDDPAGEGWFIAGPPYPHLVRQGNLVTIMGQLTWARPASFVTYPYAKALIIKDAGIPAEFLPLTSRHIMAGGPGFSDDRLWKLHVRLTSGTFLRASDLNADGGATYPWGDLQDAGNQVVTFNASYVIEPAANTAP